jgi:hypothetical protein
MEKGNICLGGAISAIVDAQDLRGSEAERTDKLFDM